MENWIGILAMNAGSAWKGFFAQADHLNALLALISLVIGILLVVPSLRERNTDKNAKRFCGAFLLLALAFDANSAWVYSIAVFVVATLITELDFLSNLAAISWNRPWAIQRPASAEEIQAKLEEDVVKADDLEPVPGVVQGITSELPELQASTETKSRRNFNLSHASEFEKAVLEELAQTGLFDHMQSETAITVVSSPNPITVLDGIGFVGPKRFVIEIKMRVSNWKQVENQVRLGINAFLNTAEMKRRLVKAPVRGIIVTNAKDYAGDRISSDIAVLYFDENTKSFTNFNQVRSWVRSV